jgi:hypothetical protein
MVQTNTSSRFEICLGNTRKKAERFFYSFKNNQLGRFYGE